MLSSHILVLLHYQANSTLPHPHIQSPTSQSRQLEDPPLSPSPTSSTCPPPHPHSSQPTNWRRGGWLSYPHRLGVNCITVKRPDERRCLTGQEHAGEDGLLSLHPLTSLSPDDEKTDTSSSTVMRCTPPPPGTSGCLSKVLRKL
jgi:hypothetical protein